MTSDQVRFKKLFEFGKQLRNRHLHAIAARKVFDEFNKLSATNIVGKKNAEANVKIFNFYKYFFLTSKEAVRCFFMIELAKFFDEDARKQTLSIQNIIHYAEKRIESFSVDEFHKYHNERYIIPELFEKFKALTKSDLNKIKKRLKRNKNRIENLKKYRDKFLAHDDIKKKDILIHRKDIDVLLKIIKDTIALIYTKLEFSVNSYQNYEEEPVREINRLMKALKEHEDQRLADIEKKYGVKVPR